MLEQLEPGNICHQVTKTPRVLLGSKKPGPASGPMGQVRDQWLCPYKSTGVMKYWSVD